MEITQQRLDEAIREARSGAAQNLWTSIVNRTGGSAADVASALRSHYGISTIEDAELESADVKPDKLAGAAGFWVKYGSRWLLICADPWGTAVSTELTRRPDSAPVIAQPGQMEKLIARSNRASHATTTQSRENDGSESPVVAFVDNAIRRAYKEGASDIHFESDRGGLAVKFRIDGVMSGGERYEDPRRAEEIISRIKVMAQLDITERRRPQDGRIHWEQRGADALDLRVSIMPSIFGEDAVLRLLDRAQLRQAQTISLSALGFEDYHAHKIRRLAAKPHGMLLVTGPTGSGKTTTVYAALAEINNGLEKIVTIEDPVEYELPGVLQIPVNEQKGLTFATGLRSILRHDPDKILVGEIRDAETAEIAVQSSLTGHLVMTTVHANSLFDVLGRFQHFHIEPFALASALNGIVVQRLLRRTCKECMIWRTASASEVMEYLNLGLETPESLPVAVGCSHCRNSGYRGRMVIAEVHEMADEHRDLIVQRASLAELKNAIYKADSVNLASQSMIRVRDGRTTIEEVRRVVG